MLKTKLGVLREADLKALRHYYESQLEVYYRHLAEKEGIILATREKLHGELMKKAEMRKQTQIDSAEHKVRVGELTNRLNLLEKEVSSGER